jgi:hypothetical protein
VTGDAFSAPAVGGQSYVERPPVPALRELASSVWVQQVGRDAAPYVHRRIPNGAVELVCKVGSTPQVIGPLTEPQLRRRCRMAVGLAPKVLHRMLRFQGFLALVQQAIAHDRAATDDGLALLAGRV